jgi:hypothetical protein
VTIEEVRRVLAKPVAALLILAVGLACSAPVAGQPDEAEGERLLRTDSRAPYVHRLNLRDHDGTEIDPTDEFAGPYSSRATCAKCHPYAVIASGWHFNAPDPHVPAGRPGEPWFLVDPATGTQLPISYRKWPGTFTPAQVGLDEWDTVMRFGRHMPGGGCGEPDDERVQASPKAVRWGISGRLEIDCMFCHSADQQHDPAEAARQIELENFRWSATAALGLAAVRGEARKAPDDWDPLMPPDPDFPERAGPQIIWDSRRFDPDNRVFFNTTGRPPAERCYFCHSFRQVGQRAEEPWTPPQDVHLAAGLTCVDCHRHGINHLMTRGYATEAAERGEPTLATFSCDGCHLGTQAGDEAAVLFGGRYGAPHPQHRGLPPLHFEKLTCTTCHSGPWPELYARRYQTALTHGLGLATREREEDDPPEIVGPVFARQHDGAIAPQRLVWPAFWGRLVGEDVEPVSLDTARQAVERVAPERFRDEAPERGPLQVEQIISALKVLAEQAGQGQTPVYIRDGRMYVHAGDGQCDILPRNDSELEPRAAPYRWSIAHNVRPAAQSLGVRDCDDCHDKRGAIFFGRTNAMDSTANPGPPIRTMHELRGEAPILSRAWGVGFTFRPAFKWFGAACLALLALILLHYILGGLDGLLRRFR